MPGPGSDSVHEGTRSFQPDAQRLGLPSLLEDRLMPLPAALKLFALLFFEGASLGMALWGTRGETLTHYALHNQIPGEERRTLLLSMIVGGAFALAAGSMFLRLAKQKPAERLSRFAWQASPLLLAGFLPVLFHWQIWAARELTFGVWACLMGFLFYVCLTRSVEAGLGQDRELWEAVRRELSRVASRIEGFAPPLIVGAAALFHTLYFSY
jgi:hypothetical protein